jgi:methionyl-tRNA formyltransferase
VCQPDRPKGRGHETIAPPVKQVAQRAGIPILQPLKMKDPAFLDALRAWQPDLIAVAAFGRILPLVILEMPPRGCINVHGSLLPKYRGAGPIQWAVINGERETGITTMLMDAGMDTGDMLLQEALPIGPDETAGELSPRMAALGARLLIETLRQWEAGTLKPTPQDNAGATMAPMLKKEDGRIDWSLSATAIANRVRGLSPWPGAYTALNGERLTIWRAQPLLATGPLAAPGTIVDAQKTGLTVMTGDGLLHITELQPANGRRMAVRDYLAGHPVKPGSGFALGATETP